MQIYCSGSKTHTDNICQKNSCITNKKLTGKLICADCMAIKLFSDKVKHKSELEIIVSQFLIDRTLIWLNKTC